MNSIWGCGVPRYSKEVPKRSVSDSTLISIGRRITWLREALGHTQADWARRMRMSATSLNKWEAGSRLPNVNALITICDASGASMDYLLRGIVTAEMTPYLVEMLHRQHAADLVFRVPPHPERS
jgi:transcriptional regulator with XRE-family HTH domain